MESSREKKTSLVSLSIVSLDRDVSAEGHQNTPYFSLFNLGVSS
jgi:hypothetical protein